MVASAKPLTPEVEACADRCESELALYGFRRIARVLEHASKTDLAFVHTSGATLVVRCTIHAQAADYDALGTMICEGDFDRAVMVQCRGGQPAPFADVETCSLDTLPHLLARWASEGGR